MTDTTEIEVKPKRKRRTNAEILADQVAKDAQRKRIRRSKAQIEADNAAEAAKRAEIAAARVAHIPQKKPIVFKKVVTLLVDNFWVYGEYHPAGKVIKIVEGSKEFGLSFDREGNFIFDKTPEEQLELWGVVKYEVH